MTALTITRPFNGVGDWMMSLACAKYVNRQRPDVQIFVDFQHVNVGTLPSIVPSLFHASDVRYTFGCGPSDQMWTRDSLVYRKWPPDLFIESMVHHLNDQTGLEIRYEHGVYPTWDVQRGLRGNYIVMNMGKKRSRGGKHWGMHNFNVLAQLLRARGYEVVQIGSYLDKELPDANKHMFGAEAGTLLGWMCGARAFIGVENGLMVLAGYLGLRQFTIYDGNGLPTRVDFANQVKLIPHIEPGPVCDQVVEALDGVWRENVAC